MGRGRWEEDSDTVSLVNIRYEDTEDPKESDQHIVSVSFNTLFVTMYVPWTTVKKILHC